MGSHPRGTSVRVSRQEDILRLRARTIVVLAAAVLCLAVALTRRLWIGAIGQSLICSTSVAPSDALLIDNVDYNYLIFEEAAALRQSGVAQRIFVNAPASSSPDRVNLVSRRIVEVMAEVAGLCGVTVVPVREAEPISLNVALGIRQGLVNAGVKSVVVVTPAFRSRRSHLIYTRVLSGAGITVGCVPVFGARTPETWAQTWHGIQEVIEQVIKLQYYRYYVIPMNR